jgi:hypothetical protein
MDIAEEEMPGISIFYENDAGEISTAIGRMRAAWTSQSAPTTTWT